MTAVSSQLFVIDRTDPFSKNLLHYPPICAHLHKYINLAGASLYETSDGKAAWQAKLLRGGSFGVLYTGYIVNSLIALVETIVSFVHFFFAFYAYRCSSTPSIEKYAVKAGAHCVHSLQILVSQVKIMWTRQCWKERRGVNGNFHLTYLEIAVNSYAGLIDADRRFAGREGEKEELIKKRAVMLLMEALPARMPDIFRLSYQSLNFQIQPPQEGDLEDFSRHSAQWETWLQSPTIENFQKMLKVYSLFLFLNKKGTLLR